MTKTSRMTNCRLSFICSEEWKHLTVGEVPGVRHCDRCKTNVYAVYSETEFDVQKEHGHCVALFLDSDAVTLGMVFDPPQFDRPAPRFDPILNRPAEELDLPVHICDALARHGFGRVGDVIGIAPARALELLRGSQADFYILEESLASRGLTLGMEIDGWPPHESGQST